MELKPHFRIVRFSPTPEVVEPVNVALLFVDERARLITDNEFQKLHCVAPRFNPHLLETLLRNIQDEIGQQNPNQAHSFLSSHTGQLQVGEPHRLMAQVSPEMESRLVDLYLKRHARPSQHHESHVHYVDTLLDNELKKWKCDTHALLKRADPKKFLSPRGYDLLEAKSMRFSRVLNGAKRLVLIDGLNFAISSKAQIKMRSQAICFGFFSFGRIREKLQEIENREVTRAALIFGRPLMLEPELSYCEEQVRRDADLTVDTSTTVNASKLTELIHSSSGDLIA
jgi:hypothetical protein